MQKVFCFWQNFFSLYWRSFPKEILSFSLLVPYVYCAMKKFSEMIISVFCAVIKCLKRPTNMFWQFALGCVGAVYEHIWLWCRRSVASNGGRYWSRRDRNETSADIIRNMLTYVWRVSNASAHTLCAECRHGSCRHFFSIKPKFSPCCCSMFQLFFITLQKKMALGPQNDIWIWKRRRRLYSQ